MFIPRCVFEILPPTHLGTAIAGVINWNLRQPQADGDSITLYEHKARSPQHHGDPIADVYAVVARPNSCIMAVADGCNWGIKPRLAARCAVHGCIEYLHSKLFECPKMPGTTQDIFHNILRSLHNAQKLIIDHGGTTTTLSVAVIVELAEGKGNKWGLCVVSVGDTLCYVWRNDVQAVHEVTFAMHQGKERNARDSGGCLGADLGDNPDLSNLCCCFVPISEGDIVFIMSDGISDNFDPVYLREAVPESQFTPKPQIPSVPGFPPLPEEEPLQAEMNVVTPEQREALALMKITTTLKQQWLLNRSLTAQGVKDALINYVIEATEDKRNFLEHIWNETDEKDMTPSQKRARDRRISKNLKQYPGKLDHATVAAYKVGKMLSVAESDLRRGHSPTNSYVMNTAITSAPQMRRGESFSAHGGSIFYSNPKASKERVNPGVV